MRKSILTPIILSLILSLASELAAYNFVPGDIDERQGPKVYQLGNSHTDSMREELAGLAVAAGHKGYAFGTHTIPGAPLRWLKGHPSNSFEMLKKHAWDFVIMQSYNSTTEEEIQAAIDYAKAAREGNPKVHIIMYSIWPNSEDWDEPTLGRREEWNEGVAARIRKELPDTTVSVAPTSLIIRRVGDMADAGLIPGMQSRRDLFNDPGHMGPNGAYAIAATMCAIIFQESPVGYPSAVLKAQGGNVGDEVAFDLGEETARAIQHVVWDTLAEYQQDNVDTGLVINAGRMPPAIIGRQYNEALPIVNADATPTLEITDGSLPQGLTIQNGRIVGTPESKATAHFALRARAAGETAERRLTLIVDEDKPLEIPAQNPLELAADAYIFKHLHADGSIGRATWSLAGGDLPPGLKLTDAGLLMGTPGMAGDYTVTLQATDKHPDGPRTATKEMQIQVGPPSPESYVIGTTNEAMQQDGKLSEGFWNLDQVIRDESGKEIGRFGAIRYVDPKRPDKNQNLYIGVKVTAPEEGGIPRQAVHFYFDTIHNREHIYNEDDVHYVVYLCDEPWIHPRTKEKFLHTDDIIQGYKASRLFKEYVHVSDDGSWTLELEVSGKMFAGRGVHTQFGQGVTYGFELAIGSLEDPTRRAYWKSGPEADKDTAVFGSLVLR